MSDHIDYLFIDPPSREKLYDDSHKGRTEGHLPSLGIAILAAMLEREGYKVAIWDAMAMGASLKRIIEVVRELQPRYVGLTAMTHNITSAATIARAIKEIFPTIITMVGGSHVTAVPSQTFAKYPGAFDICAIGEGEYTIVELLEALEGGASLQSVNGIAYMEDERFIQTCSRDMNKDMDRLPLPAWHLLPDLKTHYLPTYTATGGAATNHLLTSRGCPAKCIFCDTSVNGRKVRGYSADYVLEMIEILHKKYGIDDIQINDDTYVSLKKRVIEISERLIQKNWKLTWSCDARASSVTQQGLEAMGASGCWQIAYGVETGSERIMQLLEKKISFKQIFNAFRWAREAGIGPKGFFIVGHPGETHESIQQTVNLIGKLDMDVVGCTYFTVFPGSPIHSKAMMYGKFDPDWDRTNTYEVGNFIPYGFTANELIHYRRKALRSFYFKPRYVFKQLANIKSPEQAVRLVASAGRVFKKIVLPYNTGEPTPAHLKP